MNHRLSSTVAFYAGTVGEHVRELLAGAARHRVEAPPGREQERLEQRVLLQVFGPSRALEAINGGNAEVVQELFLHVTPESRIVLVEDEDGRSLGSGAIRFQDAAWYILYT